MQEIVVPAESKLFYLLESCHAEERGISNYNEYEMSRLSFFKFDDLIRNTDRHDKTPNNENL